VPELFIFELLFAEVELLETVAAGVVPLLLASVFMLLLQLWLLSNVIRLLSQDGTYIGKPARPADITATADNDSNSNFVFVP
jgi:hypothetical protein